MRRYIKLHTVLTDNPKIQGLSSDAARWHYVKLLLHAKQTEPEGRWRNMDQLRASVGAETFAYVPEFLETQPEGLLVIGDDGQVRIRQWWYWQGSDLKARTDDLTDQQQERKRAREAEKKRRYRARLKERDGGHVHPVHPNKKDSPSTRTVDGASADAPAPPRSDASEEVRETDCFACSRPVTELAGNMVITYRPTRLHQRLHGPCFQDIYEREGGLGEGFEIVEYDRRGHRIVEPSGSDDGWST